MLDIFEILIMFGVVFWLRIYVVVSLFVVNNFINDIFIEEKSLVVGVKNGVFVVENFLYKYD